MVRWLGRIALVLIGLAILLGTVGWLLMRGSLPRLDGERSVNGPAAELILRRDALGVLDIQAESRSDAMFALGFVHAQERFFEMDLSRRQAAGELSALLGPMALPLDRKLRPHQFRQRAARALAALDPPKRQLLETYARGVAAGLDDLPVRPWAYLPLGQRPQPWQASDSLLVVLSMFIALDDASGQRELKLGQMHETLPPAMFAFISRGGTSWDAPLTGTALPDPSMPGPEVLDLRSFDRHLFLDPITPPRGVAEGSNQFAVSGALTQGGPALVANDMHLGLSVPCIWFRAQWSYPDADLPEGRRRLTGLTLPGVPGLVVGSNGELAWGFTNAYGDWMDWIRLQPVDGHPEQYQVAGGTGTLRLEQERIEVAGGETELLDVRNSAFGPVLAQDSAGLPMALSWSAHDPAALGLRLIDLENTRTLEAAMQLAPFTGTPPLNLVVGDRRGRIGWTLSGPVPDRDCPVSSDCNAGQPGPDWRLPVNSSELPDRARRGPLAGELTPRLVDPPDGRLWTANARVAEGEALRLLGDGGYDLGARAAQIRDDLRAREQFTEADLLAIQLDDRALFLDRWQQLLLKVLDTDSSGPRFALREHLLDPATGWNGRADPQSVGYRIVRAFRAQVHRRVMSALAAPLRQRDPTFAWPKLPQTEGVVWQLLENRPQHLLDPNFADWQALLLTCADEVAEQLSSQPGGLAARSWGEINTTLIAHPLARAMPGLVRRWLQMRPAQLPGDANMPRVQAPSFGASQRLVVGPGREESGLLHMPGGQSDHPLSPFWGAGQRDWENGSATPLLAGESMHELRLRPATAPN